MPEWFCEFWTLNARSFNTDKYCSKVCLGLSSDRVQSNFSILFESLITQKRTFFFSNFVFFYFFFLLFFAFIYIFCLSCQYLQFRLNKKSNTGIAKLNFYVKKKERKSYVKEERKRIKNRRKKDITNDQKKIFRKRISDSFLEIKEIRSMKKFFFQECVNLDPDIFLSVHIWPLFFPLRSTCWRKNKKSKIKIHRGRKKKTRRIRESSWQTITKGLCEAIGAHN